ncbi:eukaryotic translation initiation factor 3 [Fusarium sp. NRRL 52700]|nr:eukaryotic translation initiation factor 3 [Fusarium sp. NRRL 52700]
MLGNLTSFSPLALLFLTWLCLVIQFGSAAEDASLGLGHQLHQLASPGSSEPCVDIVAVHGLDGHWRKSWTASNNVFWLQDLLPSKIPCARIFSYSHDSRTRGSETPIDWDVSDHAKALLTALSTERRLTQTERTPILFIGHSLGGIILKAALLKAELARVGHLEHFKAIKLSTYAVIFLGTPHQGGEGIPLAQVLRQISSIVSHTNKRILSKMERNSEWLQELQSDYNAISQEFETIFFYETIKMDVGIMSLLIVPKHSAVVSGARNSEEIPLIADHSSMAKFTTSEDDGFKKLVNKLRIFVNVAKPKIVENWKDWEWMNKPRVIEMQQPRIGQDGKEFALGIVPSIARNPYFTGRDEILKTLNQKLASPIHSTSLKLVVLYGAGGMGKTQIATEYMHRYRADYTSLFWIDGSRNYTAAADILDCIETLQRHYEIHGLRDRPWYHHIKESLAKRFDGLRMKTQHSASASPSDASDKSLRKMFLTWLSSNGNCGWLMIIDNVDDLDSFDFRDWLPSTLCGSIIITSRRRDLAIHWNFIEVDGMTINESIKLLNESSHAVPASDAAQEWKSSLELVRQLGYLPLAISQAGDHIAMSEVDSPVSEYLFDYHRHLKMSSASKAIYNPWDSTKETVWTTWEISYEAVRERSPLAAEVLLLCGFLSPRLITAAFFIGHSSSESDIHHAIRILSYYSFLKYLDSQLPRQPTYTIHPLIHFWVRHRKDNETQKAMARRTAILLRTYNKKMSTERSKYFSSDIHIKHLLSIYEELYPCNARPLSDIIDVPARPRDVVIRDVSQDYSIASSAEGWALRLRGWIDEFYFFVKAAYQSHEDYGHADYKLLYSLRQSTSRLGADTMNWILCQALKSYPPKHPRLLEMIGNYAFSISKDANDSEDSDIAVSWYWWILLARIQVLGPRHPATAGAYLGIGIASTDCEEALAVQLKACNIRIAALGYDDILTRNALERLASRFYDCRYTTRTRKNVISPIVGLMEARGVGTANRIFGVRSALFYRMLATMDPDVALRKPMPTTWGLFLTMLEVLFDLFPLLDMESVERWSTDVLNATSGLKKPFLSSSKEHEAWISAQPYLAGLHALTKKIYEIESLIYHPPPEFEMHIASYREKHYWSPDGWNWRLLLPLARTVANYVELPSDESFLLANNAKDDPLDQRPYFKWFDLLGPILLEVRLNLVNGKMRLLWCIYMDNPQWLSPTNFGYEHLTCAAESYICEENFCQDRLVVLLILMGKLDLERRPNLLDLRMGN